MKLARLDKSRQVVRCGYIDCGEAIGLVVRNGVSPARSLFLPSGWKFEPRTGWQLTANAQQRAQVGFGPSARRRGDRHHHNYHADNVPGWLVSQFPAPFKCPKCGFVGVLSARALDVWSSSTTVGSTCATPRCPELVSDHKHCAAHRPTRGDDLSPVGHPHWLEDAEAARYRRLFLPSS